MSGDIRLDVSCLQLFGNKLSDYTISISENIHRFPQGALPFARSVRKGSE